MICILNQIHKVNWWEIILLVDYIIHLCFLRIFSSQITLLPSVVLGVYKGFILYCLVLRLKLLNFGFSIDIVMLFVAIMQI